MLDNNNIEKSLLRIADYIRCNKLVDNTEVNIPAITVKIEEGGLDLFYFSFYFLFYFLFIFIFYF